MYQYLLHFLNTVILYIAMGWAFGCGVWLALFTYIKAMKKLGVKKQENKVTFFFDKEEAE